MNSVDSKDLLVNKVRGGLVCLSTCVSLVWPWEASAGSSKTVAHAESYWLPEFGSIKRTGIHAQVFGVDAGFAVPIALPKGIYLTPQLNYHLDGALFDDPQQTDLLLHAVDLKLQLSAKLSKHWKLKLSTGLGLAGDFKEIDPGVLRGHGYGLATYSFSKSLSLGGGIYASYAFGSFLPLPALALTWSPSNSFTLDMLLPDHVTAMYNAHPRIDLFGSVSVAGQKYAIRSKDRCNLFPQTQVECVDNIAFSLVGVEAGAAFRAFSSLRITPYLGMSLYRRFEMFTVHKKPAGRDEDKLANGPYFGVRVTYSI